MYAFARTRRWIVGHILVTVLLIVFIFAGFWQLSRHEWRADINDAVRSRQDLPVLDLAEVLGEGEPEDIEYRMISAAGSFLDSDILVRSRSLNGGPGCHVLTVLDLGGGNGLVVNRGWIPLDVCEAADAATYPPASLTRIEITGRLRQTQTRGRFGAIDPPDGDLTIMARVDVERIQQQVDLQLDLVYIELTGLTGRDLPLEIPAPPTDGGPHLGYAVQWFLFAAVAAIGYPVVLRHQARQK